MKGQQARAGSGPGAGFEGGQTPLIRRLPRRRGFRNPFRVEYTPVNLRDLARLPDGAEVTPDSLREAGVIHSLNRPIKILGDGEVATAFTVRAHRVSTPARTKIEAAGGSVEELTPRKEKERKRGKAKAKVTAPAAAEAQAEPAEEEHDDSDSATSESPATE